MKSISDNILAEVFDSTSENVQSVVWRPAFESVTGYISDSDSIDSDQPNWGIHNSPLYGISVFVDNYNFE
jgi:hypothetical protein